MTDGGDAYLGNYGISINDVAPETVIGNEEIAPEEQFWNSPYTSSVDIHSFGAVLYELFPRPIPRYCPPARIASMKDFRDGNDKSSQPEIEFEALVLRSK